MNEQINLETQKGEIQQLGLAAIKNFFNVDLKDDPKVLHFLHKKASIAMQFEKEMNVSKRAVENNYIKIFKSISTDKDELKKYIQATMPHYGASS